ncbi:MAG: DNA polymerase III subunit beta [Campylobacteraceae bacterium]|nr:DNA polymerase III subunit beta [Campylobacteraceae bacterium]
MPRQKGSGHHKSAQRRNDHKEKDNDSVIIKQMRSKYKLPSFESSMFPEFEQNPSLNEIIIDSVNLINGLRKITPAISTNNPKFELNGALIDVRNSVINLVSTDTKRLALFKIDQSAEKNLPIILPKKAIAEIQKIFSSNIKLFFDETNLIISNEDYYFFTKVINGKFPDYERIIPRDISNTFILNTEKMIDALKQVSILSPEIKITFEESQISMETIESSNEEAKTGFEAEIKLENPITLAVNSKFILDFLSQCQSENFEIGIHEPTMPFVLTSDNFSTIIMPIIL